MSEIIGFGSWVLVILLILAAFTNGFGLLGKNTYKGKWVKVRPEAMPEVMKKLQSVQAFNDAEGLSQPIEITVEYHDQSKFTYKIKIPKYVFHKVEDQVILKELGIL